MKLITELKDIAYSLPCTGFFACPGQDKKLIYAMRTCGNCSAVIRLRRIIKKLESQEKP